MVHVASYSVTPVAGATGYNWTVPSGAIGLTGQGTNSISFTYPSGFTSGTVSVMASNGCGNSGVRTLSVTKLNPATPGGIDVIQLQACPDRIYSYTVAAIPANATSILWTASAGTIVSGQGTNSVTVSYPGTVINGTVSATAVSNCGNSLARTINVKLPACVLNGREAGTISAKGIAPVSQESMAVNIFPNPTSSDFKLQVIATGSESAKVRVMDLQGRTLNQFTVKPYQTINLGASLKAGTYIVEVKQGNQLKSTRVIKF
ncbi:MAG: T9SS type A sorting domain-containing protein [Ferruginibacter sp.]